MIKFLESNKKILGIEYGDMVSDNIMITRKMLEELKNLAVSSVNIDNDIEDQLLSWVENCEQVPIMDLIGPIPEYVEKIALKHGKNVRVLITGDNLSVLPEKKLKDLLGTIIHLINNSIMHGIELPEERGLKESVATIEIRFSIDAGFLNIVYKDDGKGVKSSEILDVISYERFKEENLSLMKKRLETESDKEQERGTTSQYAGRSVGMVAVNQAIAKIDGSMKITTEAGKGTCFNIKVPIKEIKPWMSVIKKAG
ncbi:MAG: hypothetical protein HQK54_11040 [Oligoflexales bacterium]|nr:hypothetical protein [Oligoflexales bacterium]